jgi:hypothetical protein
MSTRIHFPIYHGGPDRYYSIKFLPRHYSSRYLLCGCTFPLCVKNGSCICHLRRIYTLISSSNWLNPSPPVSKCTILPNIYRGKHYILSPTLSRFKWNTSTLFRLPRCIYKMKCSVLIRVSSILCSLNTLHLYSLRSFCLPTKSYC